MALQVAQVQPQLGNAKLLITHGLMVLTAVPVHLINITDGIGPVLLIPAIRATRPTSAMTAASATSAS